MEPKTPVKRRYLFGELLLGSMFFAEEYGKRSSSPSSSSSSSFASSGDVHFEWNGQLQGSLCAGKVKT